MDATETAGPTTVHIRLKSGFAGGLHAVADGAELSVPSHCGRKALRTVVRELLSIEDGPSSPDFHFLVHASGNSEPLRTTLGKHIARRGLSVEATLELTYYLPVPAPTRAPDNTPPHNVWLSAVDVCKHGNALSVLTGSFCGTPAVRRNGDIVARGDPHAAPAKAVAWTPEGQHFLSAGQDEAMRVWTFDAENNEVRAIGVFRAEDDGACTSLEAVACGRVLGASVAAVSAFDGSVWTVPHYGLSDEAEKEAIVSDAASGPVKRARTAEGAVRAVRLAQPTGLCVPALAFAGDDLLSGGWDGFVRVWDTNIAEQSVALPAGGRAVTGVVGGKEGVVVVCGKDGAVRVLDRRADTAVVAACKRSGMHGRVANAVTWVTEGTVAATAGADGTLRVWDLRAVDVPVHVMHHVAEGGTGANVLDVASGMSEEKSVLFSAGSDGRVATFTL